ncbi:MAG: DUF1552 domain-containing protein [Myxococcota bacterium]
MILFSTPNGTVADGFWPTGSTDTFELGASHSALAPVKDALVYVRGLRYPFSHIRAHKGGSGMMWTGSSMSGESQSESGYALSASIDQLLVETLAEDTAYGSLEFAVQKRQSWQGNIYAGPSQPINAEPDPWAMFDRLFADFTLDESELEALRARKQSIIDVIKDDLARLEDSLGTEDRLKAEAHLDAVRAIEARLDDTLAAGCIIPELGAVMPYQSDDNVPVMSRLQIDLLVQSLACDLTRVASLTFGQDRCQYPWLGVPSEHHLMSHDEGDFADHLRAINRFHAEEFAYLLESLAAIPEGSGTMLDNTLVVWSSEVANGNHDESPVPVLMAGGAGGAMETGRYLDYGDVAYQGLLVSIAHAFGRDDVTAVGDLDPGDGPLPGLV